MAILTAAQCRAAAIPGLGASTSEDTLILTFVSRADAILAAWLGFPPATAGAQPTIEDVTYIEYYEGDEDPDGDGEQVLRLGFWPVLSITSIYDDPLRAYGADTLVASTDYTLDGRAGLVILGTSSIHGRWYPNKLRSIKATFVAGYATIPATLEAVALKVFSRLWRQRTGGGLQSASKGGSNVSYRAESYLDDADRAALRPYQLVRAVIG